MKMSTIRSDSDRSDGSDGSDESVDDGAKLDKRMSHRGLLWDWATHDNESFHDFDTDEAAAIRTSLLNWYTLERRKLPWRGDPGPFDGSTAGTASKTKKKAKVIADNSGQKSIQSFFGKTASTKESKVEEVPVVTSDMTVGKGSIQPAISVTGYSVWVSEIMLQQTRVEAVIPFYLAWMKTFPTVYALAKASEDEVNAHWAGLGFYRRARMLHKGSKYVVDDLDGIVPSSVDELIKIDGIGRYTASAVASIAFDQCVPVVDGNVCRVLSRLRGIANNIKAPIFKDKLGWNVAQQIVSAGDGTRAGEVNQALMELGATYCAPSGTGIDVRDPLIEFYASTQIGRGLAAVRSRNGTDEFVSAASAKRKGKRCSLCDPDGISNVLIHIQEGLRTKDADRNASDHAAAAGHASLPTAPIKKNKREEIVAVVALSCEVKGSTEKKWLMTRRPKTGLLAGQWEFPSSCVWTSADGKDKGKKQSKKNALVEVPTLSVETRQKAVDEIMADVSVALGNVPVTGFDGLWLDKNITHIFSHVRHTMHIQYGKSPFIQSKSSLSKSSLKQDGSELTLRWMAESDMKSVGITSGVKKVLTAVKEACIKEQQPTNSRRTKRRKKER